MTLRQAQSKFAILHAQWVCWVYEQGWQLTKSEGYVGDTDAADGDYDGPHMNGGLHYLKLAEDDNLFVPDPNAAGGFRWVRDGGDPAWIKAGAKAKELGLSWGGDFKDANHISLAWGGIR